MDDKILKRLHEIQIEILDEIVRVCKKNNIEYFLARRNITWSYKA
jgi:phosphorylcholine metabolism protein LicD